jgi:hypothetical protein
MTASRGLAQARHSAQVVLLYVAGQIAMRRPPVAPQAAGSDQFVDLVAELHKVDAAVGEAVPNAADRQLLGVAAIPSEDAGVGARSSVGISGRDGPELPVPRLQV